jgi:hypothetical protein
MRDSVQRLLIILGDSLRLLELIEGRLRSFPSERERFLAQDSIRRLQQAIATVARQFGDDVQIADAVVDDVSSEILSLRVPLYDVGKSGEDLEVSRSIATLLPQLNDKIDKILLTAATTGLARRRHERSPSTVDVKVDPGFAAPTRVAERKPTKKSTRRYANAALLDATSGRRLSRKSALQPGRVLSLRLDIGKLSDESHVSQPKVFPDRKLPKDVGLDVMVSSTDFAVSSSENPVMGTTVAHGNFFLPGDGGPATAPDGSKFLKFFLRAPERIGSATCRIGYYYRNILVQSQQLIADVGQSGTFDIKTDFTLSEDLTNLQTVPEQPRISVLTNSNGNGVHQIVLRSPNTQSGKGEGETFSIKEAVVGQIVKKLRTALAARAPTTKRRRRAELEQDLRELAPHGWDLYTELPGQRAYMFQPLFDNPGGFVIQILRPTTSGFVVPWSLVYEIPLPDLEKLEVCPLVSEWDEKQPLIAASVRECPHGPHKPNVLCPFGFWGFRYALEQLSSSDKPVLTINVSDTSEFVIAETQYEVDLPALAAHVDALRVTLRAALPRGELREGKDKATIQTLLGQDLPLVYFYCHGERRNMVDPDTWLGVGKRETITAKDFIGWVVTWQQIQKKRIWNEVRPLVFVNACHSLAIYPETLVSYLDAFVGTARAAGVIGTEVKVHQTLAMDIANQFFNYLLSKQHSVESALRTIRLDYLASGNLTGLIYTPYCWADLRIS